MLSSCQTGSTDSAPVQEKQVHLHDSTGFQIQLEELSLREIDFRWGNYHNPTPKVMTFQPAKKAIVSHFRLQDDTPAATAIAEKQFVIYRESPTPYDLTVAATPHKNRLFFELMLSENFYQQLFTEESPFMRRFVQDGTFNQPSPAFTARMLPAMQGIINNLQQAPYQGHLKAVYLEAKAIELFLMQVKQLDDIHLPKKITIPGKDIASLHEIKDYITQHFDRPLSLMELARKAGINQMKLKTGFKELFNTTVFGYLSDIRMQEAKRLLQEEKLYVSEVADRIGYKHPHHFTAAFRKKFGQLPRDIRK
ncbi:MAG: helix-turn-helix transcriptional regulator [Chitinophaga sp.]|uniref:helix-turn-helix transcriptional regulator n=1 Tax=Chitinophaga sp. TaxID=1869181 RepID=UPI001B01C471|nr:AraC family transcriptional regulator [Chitinophaga sp.]MBO9732799.1 helix-turn-helix transcriptional regulator [Chitinophaga sp.]